MIDHADDYNPLKPCEVCRQSGYFSHKFQAVLCDHHYFEKNGKLKKDRDVLEGFDQEVIIP
jgi:hypothetical protein